MKPLKGIFDSIGETLVPEIPDPSKAIREAIIYNNAPIKKEVDRAAFGKEAMSIDSIDQRKALKESKAEMRLDAFDTNLFQIE